MVQEGSEWCLILLFFRSSHKGSKVSLQATNSFRNSRGQAEKRIFELVNMKIDEFLELADYDWVATNVNRKESPYLLELVDYITSVIASALSNLPAQLKGYIYFGAFDHLANSLYVSEERTY